MKLLLAGLLTTMVILMGTTGQSQAESCKACTKAKAAPKYLFPKVQGFLERKPVRSYFKEKQPIRSFLKKVPVVKGLFR